MLVVRAYIRTSSFIFHSVFHRQLHAHMYMSPLQCIARGCVVVFEEMNCLCTFKRDVRRVTEHHLSYKVHSVLWSRELNQNKEEEEKKKEKNYEIDYFKTFPGHII